MGHEDSFSYFVFSCFGIKDWLSCSFTVNFGRVDKNMLSRRKETKQIKHSKNEENFQVFFSYRVHMTLQWPDGNKVIVSEIVLWPYIIISGHVSNIRLWSPLSRFSPWRVSKKNKSYIVVALHCCSNDWLGKVPDYKQSLLFDEIKKNRQSKPACGYRYSTIKRG